jgi:hypothetical protein
LGRAIPFLGFLFLAQTSGNDDPIQNGKNRFCPDFDPNYLSAFNTDTKSDDKEYILVSHYTSKDNAKKIMADGKIKPSKWEVNVFAMLEPSKKKEAYNAGAIDTEVKITFKVKKSEIIKDPGTDQPKAVMFIESGAVDLKGRDPVVIDN